MLRSGSCMLLPQPHNNYTAGYSHTSSYAALQLPQQRASHQHSRACSTSRKHAAPAAAAAAASAAALLSGSSCSWPLATHQHSRCRSSSHFTRHAAPASAADAANPAKPTPVGELSVGAVIEVACERLGTGGVGVCLWGPSQLVLLVKGALPGEQLTAVITTVKKNYAEGRKLSTQHPHRDAVQPACQYFGTCGGCNLQSLSYLAQLDHKAAYVGQMFSRVGKLNPADVATAQQPAVAAEAVYGYRNKVQMAFSSLVWHAAPSQAKSGKQQQQQQQQGAVRQGFGLGYFLPGSNSGVVPIQDCSLLSPDMNQVVHRVLDLCQQHNLQLHNSPDGKGVLRHLIIRSAAAAVAPAASLPTAAAVAPAATPGAASNTAPAAAAAAAGTAGDTTTPGPAASSSAAVLMVVLVTSPAVKKQPQALKALSAVARELYSTCPGVVGVVSSVEAAAFPSKPGGPNRAPNRSRQQGRGGSKRGMAGGTDSDSNGSDSSSSSSSSSGGSRGAQPLRVQSSKVLAGSDKLLETLCGLQFEISPHSFFQTNTAQAGRLYEIAVQAAAEVVGTGTGGREGARGLAAAASTTSRATAASSLEPGDADPGGGSMSRDAGVVLDLYCGTGTIALCLASALPGRQIVGFDVSSAAIADARANAARNGISNVDFVCVDLNQLLPSSQDSVHPSKHSSRQQEGSGGKQKPQDKADAAATQHSEQPGGQSLQSLRPSVVVVDPARAGLGQGVVQYLLRCGAQRVVYVSCNAATQARDLQLLCSSGEFKLTSWVCVDLFPQTDVAHVETVVVLDRIV